MFLLTVGAVVAFWIAAMSKGSSAVEDCAILLHVTAAAAAAAEESWFDGKTTTRSLTSTQSWRHQHRHDGINTGMTPPTMLIARQHAQVTASLQHKRQLHAAKRAC